MGGRKQSSVFRLAVGASRGLTTRSDWHARAPSGAGAPASATRTEPRLLHGEPQVALWAKCTLGCERPGCTCASRARQPRSERIWTSSSWLAKRLGSVVLHM